MLTRTSDYDSVGEKAYRRIRTDIIFGKLSPSEKLKLDRLREDYGASVGTLRELLNRLASEGLVVAEGQRGFEVAPVSAENLREIAALRLLLELHALTQSFKAGDMDWEGRVVSAYHKLSAIEKTPARRRPRRSRNMEALRLGIPPRADLGVRLECAAGNARAGLRQVSALPDDRRHLPRRDRRAANITSCSNARSAATPTPRAMCW